MTQRKPLHIKWESWIEKLVRTGVERGDFDGLAGMHQPLDSLGDPDPAWWIKAKMRREGLTYLPTTLQLKLDLETSKAAIHAARSEEVVREIVRAINERIIFVNRFGADGPPSSLMALDAEETVARWAEERSYLKS